MESSDNKTPRAVSGRPSLLNTPAGTPAANHSRTRILDSLERDGKTAAAVSARSKPSRKKYGIAALAVVLCAGVGTFLAFGSFDDASASMAAARPAHDIPVTPAVPAASTAVASAPASAQIELATASAQVPASAAAIAIVEPAAAAQPHSNPLNRLATSDAEPASAPVAATTRSSKQDKPHAKAHQESVASAKPAAPREQAKATTSRKTRKSEDDADTELVAAVIARLDKRGANPPAVAPVSATNIESQVHQCSSETDLLEARQCRNRACEGHWGKLDACPAARAPKSLRSDGAGDGQHG